ncbi:MAG TPA: YggS family pyridoxal phosphate-dependent enzyme [Paludibacteraceae bacterium]|mgnify:CR=1 FL=1|nr:YggS family pyridoxal phosphate-dependent enzyme [Paludibacteraceae bacterium]
MSVVQNITNIRKQLPKHVQLVCVSKFHSVETIQMAYDAGERIFGESRAQELAHKQALLPKDIEWHFVGTLQTNKVKQVVPIVTLIHSVDSLKLLSAINRYAENQGLISRVLLEVHIAQEETKHGFTIEEITTFFSQSLWGDYPAVQICGLMTMGTNGVTEQENRNEFESIAALFKEIKMSFNASYFNVLSMGMSNDYKIAIKAGSNMVRIGSSIFGERV